jgi:hypothetical protein
MALGTVGTHALSTLAALLHAPLLVDALDVGECGFTRCRSEDLHERLDKVYDHQIGYRDDHVQSKLDKEADELH